jgi:hypothetical protein
VILDEDLVLLEPLLVASIRVPDHTRAVSIKKQQQGPKCAFRFIPQFTSYKVVRKGGHR